MSRFRNVFVSFFLLLIVGVTALAYFLPYKIYPKNINYVKVDSTLKIPYISPELKQYVLDYLIDMYTNKVDITNFMKLDSIIVVPLSDTICESQQAIGCYDKNVVKIKIFNPDLNFNSEENRTFYLKLLVYHELGHAILKLKHVWSILAIMTPQQQAPLEVYQVYWKYLHDDYIKYYLWAVKNHELGEFNFSSH